MDMATFIEKRRQSPSYQKSIKVLLDITEINSLTNNNMDRADLSKRLGIHRLALESVLAGNPNVPIKIYNKVINSLDKYEHSLKVKAKH